MARDCTTWTFAERLAEVRLYRNLSLAKLEAMTGISRGLLHKYERGTDPGAANLLKLSDALGSSLDFLLRGVGSLTEYPNTADA